LILLVCHEAGLRKKEASAAEGFKRNV